MTTKALAFVLLVVTSCDKKQETTTKAEVLPPPSPPPGAVGSVHVDRFDAAEVAVPPGKSNLHVAWSVPDGTAINDDAPFGVRWGSSDGLVTPPTDIRGTGKQVKGGFDVPIDVMPGAEGATLGGDIDLVVCDVETHAVCVPLKRKLSLTFATSKATTQGRVMLPLPKAKP
jgi:hypothetical protein